MASTIFVFRRMCQVEGRCLPERTRLGEADTGVYSSRREPHLPWRCRLLQFIVQGLQTDSRISAARVLLLLVASRVFKISIFSASPTVVPTPSRTGQDH